MNIIEAISFPLRLTILFLVGTVVGSQLNRAIHSWTCVPRLIGPWCQPPENAPKRRWSDFIPVVGWLGLRRESGIQGNGYWIRPLLIELCTGAGFALLYWLEIKQRLLWPAGMGGAVEATVLHAQYLSHLVLISLMVVATFTDFYDRTIPDEITLPGAIAGLVLAAVLPMSLLPTVYEPALGAPSLHQLVLTSSSESEIWEDGLGGPFSWPPMLNATDGLWVALICIWAWCFVIQRKTWYLGHGWGKAFRYLVASVLPSTVVLDAHGRGSGDGHRGFRLVFGRRTLAGLIVFVVGARLRGGADLVCADCGRACVRPRSNGVGRCDLDGDDRHFRRLAVDVSDLFHGPLFSFGHRLGAMARHTRPLYCVRSVLVSVYHDIAGWLGCRLARLGDAHV